MICKECNSNVPDGVVFCPYCGAMIGEFEDLEGTSVLGNETPSDVDNLDTTVLYEEGTALLDEETAYLDQEDEVQVEAPQENQAYAQVDVPQEKQETPQPKVINPAYINNGAVNPPVKKKGNKKPFIIVGVVVAAVLIVAVLGSLIYDATYTDYYDDETPEDSYVDEMPEDFYDDETPENSYDDETPEEPQPDDNSGSDTIVFYDENTGESYNITVPLTYSELKSILNFTCDFEDDKVESHVSCGFSVSVHNDSDLGLSVYNNGAADDEIKNLYVDEISVDSVDFSIDGISVGSTREEVDAILIDKSDDYTVGDSIYGEFDITYHCGNCSYWIFFDSSSNTVISINCLLETR